LQLLFFLILLFVAPLEGGVSTPTVTAYFSPDDHLERRLVELIGKEKKSILACVYAFTHRDVVGALIDAKKRGVNVEVIVDRFCVRATSPLYKLAEASIPVNVWDPDRPKRMKAHRPLMHNKFFVFGDQTVWTGSYNVTYEASKMHQENALLIQNETVAAVYKSQFSTIKMRSCITLSSFIAAHPNKRPKQIRNI
jgi:phosphatidylserine/phosphatidylglycerophosphate/cardiolipin synthase-like enzyme